MYLDASGNLLQREGLAVGLVQQLQGPAEPKWRSSLLAERSAAHPLKHVGTQLVQLQTVERSRSKRTEHSHPEPRHFGSAQIRNKTRRGQKLARGRQKRIAQLHAEHARSADSHLV